LFCLLNTYEAKFVSTTEEHKLLQLREAARAMHVHIAHRHIVDLVVTAVYVCLCNVLISCKPPAQMSAAGSQVSPARTHVVMTCAEGVRLLIMMMANAVRKYPITASRHCAQTVTGGSQALQTPLASVQASYTARQYREHAGQAKATHQ
jgi:hypothetical protein